MCGGQGLSDDAAGVDSSGCVKCHDCAGGETMVEAGGPENSSSNGCMEDKPLWGGHDTVDRCVEDAADIIPN